METINISVTPAQGEYVRRRVGSEFGNASELFREMLRERMEREIETDLALLDATMPGAKPGPSEKQLERIVAAQKKARHARRV